MNNYFVIKQQKTRCQRVKVFFSLQIISYKSTLLPPLATFLGIRGKWELFGGTDIWLIKLETTPLHANQVLLLT